MTVTPNFDLFIIQTQGYLAADRCRRLLFTTIISPKRSVNIVEAHDAGFESIIFRVIATQFLCIELLPPITGLGLGREGVLFLQRRDVGILLLALCVYTSRRRKQESFNAILPTGLQHMSVDQDVVMGDARVKCSDVTDAPHVGCQVVDLVDVASSRHQTAIPAA